MTDPLGPFADEFAPVGRIVPTGDDVINKHLKDIEHTPPIHFHLIDPECKPRPHSDGALGYDVCSHSDITLLPHKPVLIPLGFRLAYDSIYVCLLMARSSLHLVNLIPANGVGLIDPDYRGEVMMPLLNIGTEPYVVKRFHRIGQLVFLCSAYLRPTDIRYSTGPDDPLPPTTRGTSGFGSTGTHQ